MTPRTLNYTLLNALLEKDTDTIIFELEPLIFKNIKGANYSIREDLYQELVLTILKVTSDFDFEKSGDLLEYLSKYCEK